MGMKRFHFLMAAACAAGSILAATLSPSAGALAADAATQGKTVAFVPGVVGNAFYISMECGIRAEAEKYGFTVNMQGRSNSIPPCKRRSLMAWWRPIPRDC
jgi:ribose transport system substrate-binding protein